MAVYFIQAGGPKGPVKMGTSKRVAARLRELQNVHYAELRLLRTIDGSFKLEAVLRRLFEPHRIRGEWYRLAPEMLTVGAEIAVPVMSSAGRSPRIASEAGIHRKLSATAARLLMENVELAAQMASMHTYA